MHQIIAIARITAKEGLRTRLLLGTIVFALLIMAFSVLVSGLFLRDISKVTLDFCLSAVTIGGLLIPFFIAISSLAKDLERKTIYTILARPITRPQYIIGKFCGLVVIIAFTMAILTVAALLAIWLDTQIYRAEYFVSLSIPTVLAAIGLSFAGIVVFTSVVVLWCCITTSPFLATLLTIFTYVIGHTVEDMVYFIANPPPDVEISKSVAFSVHLAQYLFPNLAAFDFKLQAAHGLNLPLAEIGMLLLYGLTYCVAILAISILIFQRRELT